MIATAKYYLFSWIFSPLSFSSNFFVTLLHVLLICFREVIGIEYSIGKIGKTYLYYRSDIIVLDNYHHDMGIYISEYLWRFHAHN